MEGWRLAAFEQFRQEFAEAARTYSDSELRVFVNDHWSRESTCCTGPRISVEDGLGGGTKDFQFWAVDGEPKAWWFGSFRDRGPAAREPRAFRRYTELAKHVGELASELASVRAMGITPSSRHDDLWTLVLFALSWRRIPGCPLKSWCSQVDEEGYRGIEPPKSLHDAPLGLRCELGINPFAASVYAIGLLLDEESRSAVAAGKGDPLSPIGPLSVAGAEGSGDESASVGSVAPPQMGSGRRARRSEWAPASFFPKQMRARLRKAASGGRKSMRVRTKKADGVLLYNVRDARKWWPGDVPD